MAKLLIVGVDSMVGSNLALALSREFDVIGLHQQKPFHLPAIRTSGCRTDDPAAVASAVRRRKPRWIIHCGPLAQSSWDQRGLAGLTPVTVNVALAIAEAARDVGSRLTYLSTDAVFSGPRMFHNEQSPGKSSGEAVQGIEQTLETTGALIVRTHCYGWSPAGQRPVWIERLATAMFEGQPPDAHGSHHATPILATDLAQLLLRAYRLDVRGVLHLAGAERIGQRRLAAELAAMWPDLCSGAIGSLPALGGNSGAMGSLPALGGVRAMSCKGGQAAHGTLPDSDTAARETSLDTRRARRLLGRPMPMLREGLCRFVAQAFDGHRRRLRSAVATPHRRAA